MADGSCYVVEREGEEKGEIGREGEDGHLLVTRSYLSAWW